MLHVPDLALWARQKIQQNQQGQIPVDGCLLTAVDDLRQMQLLRKLHHLFRCETEGLYKAVANTTLA